MPFGSSPAAMSRSGTPSPGAVAAGTVRIRQSPDRSKKTSAAIRKGTIKISGPTLLSRPSGEDFLPRSVRAITYDENPAPSDRNDSENIGMAMTTSEVLPPSCNEGLSIKSRQDCKDTDFAFGVVNNAPSSNSQICREPLYSEPAALNVPDKKESKGLRNVLRRMFRRGTQKGPAEPTANRHVQRGRRVTEHHWSDPGLLSQQLDHHLTSTMKLTRATSVQASGDRKKLTAINVYPSSSAPEKFEFSRTSRELPLRQRGDSLLQSLAPGRSSRRASLPSVTWTGLTPRPVNILQHSGTANKFHSGVVRHGSQSIAVDSLRRRSRSANDLRFSEEACRWLALGNSQNSITTGDESQRPVSVFPPLSFLFPFPKSDQPASTSPAQKVPTLDPLRSNPITCPSSNPPSPAFDLAAPSISSEIERRVSALEGAVSSLREDLLRLPRVTCSQAPSFTLATAPQHRSSTTSSTHNSTILASTVAVASSSPNPATISRSPTRRQGHTVAASTDSTRSFERTDRYNNIPMTPREEALAALESAAPPAGPQMLEIANTIEKEDFITLLSLLRHERGCRKRLEREVGWLRREVLSFKGPGATGMGRIGSTSYPTPSPDLVDRQRESIATTRHSSSPDFGRSSREEVSSVTSTEYGDDEDPGKESASVSEDEDVYVTPAEMKEDEAGEEERLWGCAGKETLERKVGERMARNLSLGQLTTSRLI